MISGLDSFDQNFLSFYSEVSAERATSNAASLWLKTIMQFDGNVDTCLTSASGWALIHLVTANFGNPHMLRLLLARGASPNLRTVKSAMGRWNNSSPLHLACMFRHAHSTDECIKMLVAAGADLEAKTQSGKTPILLIKATVANLELMRSLGANLNATYPDVGCPDVPLGLDSAVLTSLIMPHPSPSGNVTKQECGAALDWCREQGVVVTEATKQGFELSSEAGMPPGCPTS